MADKSPPALKHRDLLVILIHFGTIDQINFPWFAGIESLCRFVLQIEAAVKKCPKLPDFKSTEHIVASKLDSAGGVLVGDFARCVAEEQSVESFTLKQQRLHAEEMEKEALKRGKVS